MGSFANVWELAGGTLVGASDDAFSDYHIASDAQKIGDFSSLNAESIIALNPDFVILTGSSSGRGGGVAQTELADTLTAANIPVAYFKVTTFDDYLRMLRTCCNITGDEQAYAENGQGPADRIAEICAKAEGVAAQRRGADHAFGWYARAVVLDADGNHACRFGSAVEYR